jgi:hypothetical protein
MRFEKDRSRLPRRSWRPARGQSISFSCNPKPTGTTAWPSRILQVADLITLVDFDAASMAGNFTALSYCWGDKAGLETRPPLTATAKTLPSLQSGISASDLPQTLREAVELCSRLRIRWIWIDSLCIVQDDPHDWEVEAQKMETGVLASHFHHHRGFFDILSQWLRQLEY